MLNQSYGWSESDIKNNGAIAVKGIPKIFFKSLIQYIYSDYFYNARNDAEYFIRFLIYADYFMLSRLVDICSNYLKQFINIQTVMQIFLIAHSHNAKKLKKFCIHYIALNEKEFFSSRMWRYFKRQATDELSDLLIKLIDKEKE
jgi:hypothetical protein